MSENVSYLNQTKAERDEVESTEQTVLPSPKNPVAVARALVADRFTDDEGDLLLRRWRGGWWQWKSSHWAEIDVTVIDKAAYRFTEHAVFMEKTTPKPWEPNRYKIADLLAALAAVTLSEATETPAWLDDAEGPPANEIVACANGLLHIGTRVLHLHDPRYFNQVAVPFDFDPTAATPGRWLRFLAELWPDDPDSISALQEFVGYVISGRIDLHKILLLIGPTRAGKGVIARILKALVGKGNYAGPTLASLGTQFGLQPLIGKPLAIISDARLGGGNVHQVVERLLSISGEDMLSIDIKFKEAWTGTLPTRFLVISNELPRFGDASGAIANRFVVLSLNQSWLGQENTALTDELLVELPGILNWALTGLERLTQQGRFTEPASSRDAIVALQDLVSPVAAFVRDCCKVGVDLDVERGVLYAAWKEWADDNGHRPGSSHTFGRDLRAVVPRLGTSRPRDDDAKRTRSYTGVTFIRLCNGEKRGPGGPEDQKPTSGPRGPRENPIAGLCEDCGAPATQAWPDVDLCEPCARVRVEGEAS